MMFLSLAVDLQHKNGSKAFAGVVDYGSLSFLAI